MVFLYTSNEQSKIKLRKSFQLKTQNKTLKNKFNKRVARLVEWKLRKKKKPVARK